MQWRKFQKYLLKKFKSHVNDFLEWPSKENLKEGHSIRQDRKIGIASVGNTEGEKQGMNWFQINKCCMFSFCFCTFP